VIGDNETNEAKKTQAPFPSQIPVLQGTTCSIGGMKAIKQERHNFNFRLKFQFHTAHNSRLGEGKTAPGIILRRD
jgi:hypothetical protein